MMIYKSEEYYKGRINAFKSTLLFVEMEVENAHTEDERRQAERIAHWLREAIGNELEERREAQKATSYT